MYIYSEINFSKFDIDCGDTDQCNIIINSEKFKAVNMIIKGVNVQMNAP